MLLARMRPSLIESDNSGLPVIQEFLRIDSRADLSIQIRPTSSKPLLLVNLRLADNVTRTR
jgi:hypothetical protein